MPGWPDSEMTRPECRRRRYSLHMRVPARRGVPNFLRCIHDHNGGVRKDRAGDIVCEHCACLWRSAVTTLSRAIEEALSGNMLDWRREGRVVLRCGDRQP